MTPRTWLIAAGLVSMLILMARAMVAETWAWDPADGALGYQVEDSAGVFRVTQAPTITIDPPDPMRSIRVRATDGTNFGPPSEWSFRAGFNPDCDGDGFVFPSDYLCFLEAAKVGLWPH